MKLLRLYQSNLIQLQYVYIINSFKIRKHFCCRGLLLHEHRSVTNAFTVAGSEKFLTGLQFALPESKLHCNVALQTCCI